MGDFMNPTVIIDGNNLAFQRYIFRGPSVPASIFEQMISDLEKFAEHEKCLVELCLDPCAIEPTNHKPVSVFVDHRKADEIVQERVAWHFYTENPCVVVTLDGEVCQETRDLGIQTILTCIVF